MTASRTFYCMTFADGCGVAAVGTRADAPDVRHAIDAAHVQQVRADTGGDPARWRQMYQNVVTPDFTFTLANGKTLSREQFQQRQLKFMLLMKQYQEAFHIQRVTRTGDQATEEGFLTYRVSIVDTAGRMGPQGKTHLVTGRNTYRAGWAKVGTSWRLADFHLLKHEEQTDGKPSGV
jgi:hypothetical protein